MEKNDDHVDFVSGSPEHTQDYASNLEYPLGMPLRLKLSRNTILNCADMLKRHCTGTQGIVVGDNQ